MSECGVAMLTNQKIMINKHDCLSFVLGEVLYP